MSEAKEIKYTYEQLKKKLTQKQKIFCHEVIIDWNSSKAAIKAGYSKKTAYSIGSENLRKPEIKQYIEYIKHDIEKEAGISKLMMIKELKNLAMANLPVILHKVLENEPLTEEEQLAISEIHDDTKKYIEGEKEVTNRTVKLKVPDKRALWADIAKAMGYNEAEKLDHISSDGSMSVENIDLSNLTQEEIITFGRL